jgi:quercetin dioxygenase-like cupin family protein
MAVTHAKPGEKIRLASIDADAPTVRATALVKTDRFEVAQLFLRSGETIPAHSVEGYVTLSCLEGSVVLQLEKAVELARGDWIYLARGERHALQATSDSSLLLTILFD